ncbi:ABC-2 family transporter protein [Caproicibacterium argilliputei]
MKLFLQYWKMSIHSQISYKKDFAAELMVWFFYSSVPFFALSLLLERFGRIGNLSIGQIAVLYGISQISYDLARMVGRGFDNFSEIVFSGDFDLFYIRPLGILCQVFASDLFLRRMAGILQGCALVLYGVEKLRLFSPLNFAEMILIIFSAFFMYLAFFILRASLTLVTLRENVFIGYLFDLVSQTGYFPIHLLKNPIRFILTYLLPVGLCIYYPVMNLLLGWHTSRYLFLSMAVSFSVFMVSLLLFSLGRRHYQSINN